MTKVHHRVTVNGHLSTKVLDDIARIEFIEKYGKGNNIDLVRDAIDCLKKATEIFGHWSLMDKRLTGIDELLRKLDNIQFVEGRAREDGKGSGLEMDVSQFLDEE